MNIPIPINIKFLHKVVDIYIEKARNSKYIIKYIQTLEIVVKASARVIDIFRLMLQKIYNDNTIKNNNKTIEVVIIKNDNLLLIIVAISSIASDIISLPIQLIQENVKSNEVKISIMIEFKKDKDTLHSSLKGLARVL